MFPQDLEGLRGGSQLTVFDGDPGMRSDSAESVCDISSKLLVNVEVIRMKRMMKWQNAQLTTLLTCVDNLNQESQSMKETMNRLSEENSKFYLGANSTLCNATEVFASIVLSHVGIKRKEAF